MKKICFLMQDPFTFGGEQRVTSRISNILCSSGYEVTILCTNLKKIDYSVYDLDKRVKIVDITTRNIIERVIFKIKRELRKLNGKYGIFKKFPKILEHLYYLKTTRKKIINVIKQNNIDVVVGVSSDFCVIASGLKKYVNCRIVGWQHNNYMAYFEKEGRRFYNQKAMFQKISSNFDGYIVLTDDDAKLMKENFGLNATRIFNPLSFRDVEYSNIKERNNVFLSYGRLEYMKGFDLLLDSYIEYRNMGGSWDLTIVGDGSYKKELLEKIENNNLVECVKVLGYTKEVGKLLNSSKVLLFPSRWEGFGLVLTEAMQYALPSVCYDLQPFKEITKGYNSSILIEQFNTTKFADAMFKLSNSEKLIDKMSKEAISNVKKFSDEVILEEWKKVLED